MLPPEPTSSALPSNTVGRRTAGVPRFHSFTIRGYPDDVSEPGPKSVPSQSVSSSRHATKDLASGSDETARDELLRLRVELALDGRIRASGREADHAPHVRGSETGRPVEDPRLAVRLREGVDVEHGLPLRSGRAIGGERRAAPDPPLVLVVLPEVVHGLARRAWASGSCPSNPGSAASGRRWACTPAGPPGPRASSRCAPWPTRGPCRPARPRATRTDHRGSAPPPHPGSRAPRGQTPPPRRGSSFLHLPCAADHNGLAGGLWAGASERQGAGEVLVAGHATRAAPHSEKVAVSKPPHALPAGFS